MFHQACVRQKTKKRSPNASGGACDCLLLYEVKHHKNFYIYIVIEGKICTALYLNIMQLTNPSRAIMQFLLLSYFTILLFKMQSLMSRGKEAKSRLGSANQSSIIRNFCIRLTKRIINLGFTINSLCTLLQSVCAAFVP